ncbi:MAG: cellulose synthase/poly-beta-1,6-N-acetylglucosamine synthase-like glycosyltransferase [Arcticibacterium sp.]|jgi:cellulose synthase/poly-beta-1,6-N-acetylglucosamine synthase-like glycosyltransferase
MSQPKISILIAARNEEKNLPALLDSLVHLKYPIEKLEIIFGNDASTDDTENSLNDFTHKWSHAKVVHLQEKEPKEKLKGKTRVLDSLSRLATGDYYFFTDADVVLPPNWINGMLGAFEPNDGVVVGLSTMKSNALWPALQGMEWLSALHFMHLISLLKFPSTGMGNNMAVRKEAFEATGGYQEIGFSIVEDYALYKAVIDKGYGFKHVFNKDILAYTRPPEHYFEQRKRWMQGAFESKTKLLLPAMIQTLIFPILCLLSFWNVTVVWGVIAYLLIFIFCQFLYIEHKLNLRGYLKWVPVFVIYMPVSWFLQLLNYALPSKTNWKGRTY